MTTKSKATFLRPLRSVPPDIQALFGSAPLLSTEDPSLYREMLDRFAECVEPRNVIEWLWVKDIVDLSWEIARLRRYRALLIEARPGSPLKSEADSARLLIADHIRRYENVDKLLMSAELRRDRILRELDFRRERIAPLLRKKSDELIDVSADAVPLATE